MLINSKDDAIGEGPRLYAVVVSGGRHQKPTLWKVRAWDGPAAEVIAVAEAGYDAEDMDFFADSILIGEGFKILGHPDQLPPIKTKACNPCTEWTEESKSNGWRSNCRVCGKAAAGSGQ